MDDQKECILKELRLRKELALAASTKNFPPRFNAFAEVFVASNLFPRILQKISQEKYDKVPNHQKSIKTANKLIKSLYDSLSEYASKTKVPDVVLSGLQSFCVNYPDSCGELITIFMRSGSIKHMLQTLHQDNNQHEDFLNKIASKIQAMEQILQTLQEELHLLRRMEPATLEGSVRRICRIHSTYNPNIYKLHKAELLKQGKHIDAKALDVQYAALSRCVDPGIANTLCYDENFGTEADKLAIQDIYAWAEQEILTDKDSNFFSEHSNNSSELNKRIQFIKTSIGVEVRYGEQKTYYRLKNRSRHKK